MATGRQRGSNAGARRATRSKAAADDRASPMRVLEQFRELFRVSQVHFQRIEARCGLGGAQLWALAEVAKQPGITISQLARALAIHLSTSSNLLDKLETQRLVRRVRERQDQRLVHVYATPAGMRVLRKAPKPVEGIICDALGSLPAGRVDRLHAEMAELLRVAKFRSARAAKKPLAEP